MIETEEVLTRHDVVGVLEGAIYEVEQHLGNCYLVDQLSMLAYRIANGEAGFVEYDDEEVQDREGIAELMMDAYGDMLNDITSEEHFWHLLNDLTDKEVEEIVSWAYSCRERLAIGAGKSDPSGTTTIELLAPLNALQTIMSESHTERMQEPIDIELKALRDVMDHVTSTHTPSQNIDLQTVRAVMESLKQDAVKPKQEPKPEPGKTKNTRETILEGLEKGKLALNLISELYTKEQDKK